MSLPSWWCWVEGQPEEERVEVSAIKARYADQAACRGAELMDDGDPYVMPPDRRIICVQRQGSDKVERFEVIAEGVIQYTAFQPKPTEGGAS